MKVVLSKEKNQLKHLEELVSEKKADCINKFNEIKDLDSQSNEE